MAEKKFVVRFSTDGSGQTVAQIKAVEAAVNESSRSFDDLRASLDPAYAATRRYEQAIETATQAVKAGVATQEQANVVIAQARTRLDTFSGAVMAGGNGMRAYRGNIQNAAYQIGDFAVQVGAGTSASQAMAQQLPQLLGSFGLAGIVAGAAAAIAVPLARWFFDSGEGAKSATDAVKELEAAISRLDEANQVYSAQGLQDVIDKYGELNAEILLLIDRQQQFAMDAAFLAAKDAARSLESELSGVLTVLEFYNAELEAGDANSLGEAAAIAADMQRQFGMTVIEAQALKLAISAAMRTADAEVMASALASISTALEDSTYKGSEFAGMLLDAESALRALNAEAGGIGGWLGAAISGTATWAAGLWDAANAARAAALASTSGGMTGTAYAANTAAAGGPAGGPAYVPPPPPMRPQARPVSIDFGYSPVSVGSSGGSPSGGGGIDPYSGGRSPWFTDEQEQQIIDASKTITDAQNAYTASVNKGADAVADLFTSIIDGSSSAEDAIASLLAQMGQVAMQQAVLGLAGMGGPAGSFFEALGSSLSTPSFAGGGYTGSGSRSGGMDGQGGFLAMLHPRETVVDHTQGGGRGGTTNVYNIDARGAQAGVAEQIAKAIESYDRSKYANIRAVNGDRRRVS
jgi:uncharacterized protein YoxC